VSLRNAALAAAIVPTLVAPSLADWPQWRGPGRDGHVVALAPRAAWPEALKPAWKVSVGVGHSSPVVVGDLVFIFSRAGDDEVVQALDRASGRSVWRQSYKAPYTMNMAAMSHGKGPKSTPVVEGGRIFTFGISGILSAFDAVNGRLLWRKEFGTQFKETSPLYGVAMSPVVDQGRLIAHVGGSGGGALTAFDPATGSVLWAWKGDGPAYASPVVAELAGVRQVVTLTESNLVGVSADKGELLWKLPFTTEYVQNAVTPVVEKGLVIYTGLEHPVRAVRVSSTPITRTCSRSIRQPQVTGLPCALQSSSPSSAERIRASCSATESGRSAGKIQRRELSGRESKGSLGILEGPPGSELTGNPFYPFMRGRNSSKVSRDDAHGRPTGSLSSSVPH
jgi:outer membrane protein assembly factor BamB